MIPLTRDRRGSKITSALRGKRRIDKNLLLVQAEQAGTLDAFEHKGSRWKPAKRQLKAETRGKCAYCEASTAVVAHGDVEHFRPKSKFWWLAFCYENFLFACQICNQSFKSNQWESEGVALQAPVVATLGGTDRERAAQLTPDPLHEDQGVPWAPFWQAVDAERSDILDPYRDALDALAWKADLSARRVKLVPADGPNEVRNARIVSATERILGLNRDELQLLRFDRFEDVTSASLAVQEGNAALRADGERRVARYTAPGAPFAGMARFFFTTWDVDWRTLLDTLAPPPPPSPS